MRHRHPRRSRSERDAPCPWASASRCPLRLRGRATRESPSESSIAFRKRWAGDREGVAIRRKERARHFYDLLERDRPQLARIALGVVGAELEDLALEEQRRDAGRALACDVELA